MKRKIMSIVGAFALTALGGVQLFSPAPSKVEAQVIGVDKAFHVYVRTLERATGQWGWQFHPGLTFAQAMAWVDYYDSRMDSIDIYVGRTALEWHSPQ